MTTAPDLLRLRDCIAGVLGYAPVRFAEEARLDDLGLDSLERAELLLVVEDDFLVELDDDDFWRLETVGDLARALATARPLVPAAPIGGAA